MIGVKTKKQATSNTGSTTATVPNFNLQEGQGGVYGRVTERSIDTDQIRNVKDVTVTVFDGNTLIVLSTTSEEGIYIFDAINAPKSYLIEFRKEVTITQEFTLASKEIKEINIELLVNNF